MRVDSYGQQIYSEEDLCRLFYIDPTRKIGKVLTESKIDFDEDLMLSDTPVTVVYEDPKISVQEFDALSQQNWFIPESYKTFDIAKYVLDQCSNPEELQRAGKELIMFQERDMFPLLVYLKYLVDTMRENNVVWGVGRGSSVASFVLFLIGVHKINSLYYDLDIEEFLK